MESIPRFLCQVVTSHAIMALVASEEVMRMRVSSWSVQVLPSYSWQMLEQTQMVPSFSTTPWRAHSGIAACRLWEAWWHEHRVSILGPAMARPARRPLWLTVGSSGTFDWHRYLSASRPSLLQLGGAPPTHLLAASWSQCTVPVALGVHIFLFKFRWIAEWSFWSWVKVK